MRLPVVLCLVLALIVGARPAAADPVLDRAKARGGLIAAVNPDELPLASRDKAGALVGFDIDIANDIAKRLGLPVTLATPGWDAILSGAWDGKWDYAVASVTPTPRRKERIDFPAIYRIDAAVLVVRKGDTAITSPKAASGKSIAVKANTTFAKYLAKTLELGDLETSAIPFEIDHAKVKSFPSNGAALKAVADKQADAAITSQGVAEAAIRGGLPLRIVPRFLYFEEVGVVTAKGDPEFDEQIAAAVRAMRNDGTLAQISMKWFGIDLSTITQ